MSENVAMPESSNATTFGLLVAHAQWSCAWAWLENLDRPAPGISSLFHALEEEVDVAAIFAQPAAAPHVSASRAEGLLLQWFTGSAKRNQTQRELAHQTWRKWFGGGRRGKGKHPASAAKRISPVKTLYEARPFYGTTAPDNLLRRFNRLFTDIDYREQRSAEPDGPMSNILAWGRLAQVLVKEHGGWNEFTKLDWTAIKDTTEGKRHHLASDPDSFIQRALHLGRDRYLQILAPAVAPLWLLFVLRFFATQRRLTADWDEVFESVRELSTLSTGADPFDLQTLTATDDPKGDRLFVDIQVQRGRFRDLPFPFGAAEHALAGEAGDPEGAWEPHLIVKVRERLFEQGGLWSPPVLLCMRGDVLADGDMNRKRAVRCLSLSDPCPIFPSVFVIEGNDFKTVIGQQASWAEPAGVHFGKDFEPVSRIEFWRRATKARSTKNKELFLGYFPLDLPLRERLKPLHRRQIYGLTWKGEPLQDEVAEELAYILPGAVLAGASNLAAQPRMPVLLKDLGRLLWHLELFCRNLAARPEEVAALRDQLSDPDRRHETAALLAKECAKRAAERLDRYFRNFQKQHESLLVELMVRAGNEMVEALALKEADREKFETTMQAWGWAVLLEFLPFTSIGYGGEMVFRD